MHVEITIINHVVNTYCTYLTKYHQVYVIIVRLTSKIINSKLSLVAHVIIDHICINT